MTRDEGKAATRAEILAQAKRVFTRDGYEGATIREIAKAAGRSTGAVFSSWPGKAELYADVFGHPPLSPEDGLAMLQERTEFLELIEKVRDSHEAKSGALERIRYLLLQPITQHHRDHLGRPE